MPDITKCPGGGCPVRDHCYRFLAPDKGKHQSWMPLPKYGPQGCEYLTMTFPKPETRLFSEAQGQGTVVRGWRGKRRG